MIEFHWALLGTSSATAVLCILQLNYQRSRLMEMNRSILWNEVRSLTALRRELEAAMEAAREIVGSALHITTERDVAALAHAQRLTQLIDERIAALSALGNARSVRQLEAARNFACGDLVLKADCVNSFAFGEKEDLTVKRNELSDSVRRAVYAVNRAAKEMPRWQRQSHGASQNRRHAGTARGTR